MVPGEDAFRSILDDAENSLSSLVSPLWEAQAECVSEAGDEVDILVAKADPRRAVWRSNRRRGFGWWNGCYFYKGNG